MEYIEFSVNNPKALPLLSKELRSLFSETKRKLGSNAYGLMPKDMVGAVNTLRVYHPESVLEVIKRPAILKLASQKRIRFDIQSYDFINFAEQSFAILRERNYEKNSPIQAMTRLNNSEQTVENMLRFKRSVSDYVSTEPSHLPYVSSNKDKFSLFFRREQTHLNANELNAQTFSFNTYGLSTNDNKVYLPSF